MNSKNLSKLITIVVLIIVVIAIILLINGSGDKAKLQLVGLDKMIIYQNDQYKDPGYMIANTNSTDGYYVNVEGVVNTNKIGVYTLKYMLYNKKGTLVSTANREVIVLEDNLSNVILELIGDEEEYYFVNDYTDKGAEAYQRNKDITTLININSNVIPSVPGQYEVTYELNINNKIKSVTRKVNIIDLKVEEDIDLSNLEINLLVNCDDYSHTILPSGAKEYSKDISYSFSDIGVYEFEVVLKSGSRKKYSVDITTIDNEGPTGTCVVNYDDNKTTIIVNATDKSGIEKYSYNGLDFYNNTTTINSIATNVTVRVYDKMRNYTDIKCKAELSEGFRKIDIDDTGHVKNKKGWIKCNSNTTQASQELDNIVKSYGYKTRAAVASAATYLANYEYNIPYFWGGKTGKIGIDPTWGCNKSHKTDHNCSKPVASDRSVCEYGLDCGGLVKWSFLQAGFDADTVRGEDIVTLRWGKFNPKEHLYKFNSNNMAYINQIKPGDIVHKPGHVALVIGVEKDTLQVAEMTGPVIITIIKKSNGASINRQSSFTEFVLMEDYFKMYGSS